MKMKSKAKSFIIFGIFGVVIIALIIAVFISRTTKYNPDNATGNTSANLLNNGTFAEYEGKVYFANPEDNFYLYVMNPDETDKKLLTKDSVRSINVYGDYIFYTRIEAKGDMSFAFLNVNRYSLCRVDKNGNNKKILDSEPSLSATLSGNYIYYIRYDDKNASTLYRVKIDGKEKGELNKNPYTPSSVLNNQLYYNELEKNHHLMCLDLSTLNSKTVLEANCSNIITQGNYIYFMNNADNYAIYRLNLNDNKPEKLINKRCDFYTVNDEYIYYQTPGNNPALYRFSLKTNTEELIREGAFCDLNLTSQYLYFRQYNTKDVYKLPLNGSLDVTRF